MSGAFDRGLLLFSREQTSRRTVVTTRLKALPLGVLYLARWSHKHLNWRCQLKHSARNQVANAQSQLLSKRAHLQCRQLQGDGGALTGSERPERSLLAQTNERGSVACLEGGL